MQLPAVKPAHFQTQRRQYPAVVSCVCNYGVCVCACVCARVCVCVSEVELKRVEHVCRMFARLY